MARVALGLRGCKMIGYFIALLTIAVVSLGTAWIEGKSASLGLSMFMQASLVTVGGMAMIAMVLLLAAMQMVEDYGKRDKPRGQ